MDFHWHHLPVLAEQRREELLEEIRRNRLLPKRRRPGRAKRGMARISRALGRALIELGARLNGEEVA